LVEPWRYLTRLIWHDELPSHAGWGKVLKIARESEMLPLVAFLTLEQNTSLPEDVTNSLCEARRHAVARQVMVAHQIEQLAQVASELDTHVILLKGPVVAQTYPHPGARPFADLDVLVTSKSAAERLASALQDKGYRPHSESRAHQHLPPLYPPSAGLRVEVHYPPEEQEFQLSGGDVWQAYRPMDGVPGLWVMGDTDHALYMIAHAVQRHALESGLRWLYDLTCWTHGWDEVAWGKLVAQARHQDMMPAVRLACALWAWVQEKPWDELPCGGLIEPPPAAVEAAAKLAMLGDGSARLPTVWREGPGRGIAGWLCYGGLVLTQGGEIGVRDIPRRLIYLMRQHGPALWQLLRGDSRARSKWRAQRLLYEWLREEKGQ
jgi:hypothetical protein